LSAADHDLKAYGETEAAAFGDQHAAHSLTWPPPSRQGHSSARDGGYKWGGFSYGPRLDDWDLIWAWDPAVEELAGSFWASVEEPVLAMPGAWIDEDDPEYDEG
jgi:hypothetical protein